MTGKWLCLAPGYPHEEGCRKCRADRPPRFSFYQIAPYSGLRITARLGPVRRAYRNETPDCWRWVLAAPGLAAISAGQEAHICESVATTYGGASRIGGGGRDGSCREASRASGNID